MATLNGTSGNDVLTGTSGKDSLYGLGGADTLRGGAGDDYLVGGAEADQLYGEADNDWLIGGAGGDTVDGGLGTDMASYFGSDAGVAVTLDETGGASPSGGHAAGDTLSGIENLTGSSHGDRLTGNSKNNALSGEGGADTLRGGGGDDSLTGGAGADALYGGPGTDGANYWNSDAGVTVTLDEAGGASPTGGHAAGDTLSGIENVMGSPHRDVLTGNSKANGLVGSGGDDEIRGGGGNDWLAGDAGADDVHGGEGVDTASYTSSDAGVTVTLDEAGGASPTGGHAAGDTLSGIEVLQGSAHRDVLTGNSKNNGLVGNGGNDELRGGGGSDWLLGGADADHLYGGADNDWLTGGAGGDTVDGGPGTDTAIYLGSDAGVAVTLDETGGASPSGGHAAGDTLSGIENLTGSSHGDRLTGNSKNNALSGEGGADTLRGGGGDDSLTGGAGADALYGGPGTDGANYWNSDAGVTVTLDEAGGASPTGGHAAGDTLSGIENVMGSPHRDVLTGNSKANGLVGSGGDDEIRGGGGNDWLAGDAGADDVHGGEGVDTASYTSSDAGVTVTLDEAGGASPTGGHAAGDTLSGIEVLQGSAHRDVLTGNSKNNGLVGNGGNDELRGGGGSDWLLGGADADHLYGGADNDWLTGGAGGDTVDGGPGTDTAIYLGSDAGVTVTLDETGGASPSGGHAAGDTLSGIENLTGSSHGDRLTGNSKNNALSGEGGADTLRGGGGDDSLTGGAGADALYGGPGTDGANYWNSDAGVTVTLDEAGGASPTGGHAAGDTLSGIENVMGSPHRDVLTGNSKANGLVGSGGDDEIRGGGGNDWLAGDAGADDVHGGEGVDTASYTSSDAGVTVTLDETGGASPTGGHATGDTLSGIEVLQGSAHRDVLTGNSKNNGLVGNGGNDELRGGGGSDWLLGGADADHLYGGADNDWLTGGAGGDTVDGGPGTDTAIYLGSDAGVTVTLDETGGASPSGGHAAGDTLSGIENLTGSSHGDRLTGNSKNNALSGEGGADILRGGGGNDYIEGGPGADDLDGGPDEDTLSYAGSDAGVIVRLSWGTAQTGAGEHLEEDTFRGFENVVGSKHGDALWGDDGSNELSGGGGADRLFGGKGSDTLRGGPGNDSFVFLAADDSPPGAPDVIKDFESGDDRIDLQDLGDVSNWTFAGNEESFTGGVAGEVRYTQRTVSGTAWTDVFVDVSGDGAADLVVQLEGTHALTVNDFLLG